MSGHGLATTMETLVVGQVRPVEVQLRLDEEQCDRSRRRIWKAAAVGRDVKIGAQPRGPRAVVVHSFPLLENYDAGLKNFMANITSSP